MAKDILEEFVWEKLHQPPYSPEIVPFDYHLFKSLQSQLDVFRLPLKVLKIEF